MIPKIKELYDDTVGAQNLYAAFSEMRQWWLGPEVIEKYGTFTVDETNGIACSNFLQRKDNKVFIVGVTWFLTARWIDAMEDDPWSLFNTTMFQWTVGGQVVGEISAASYPVLSRMVSGKMESRRKMMKNADGTVTFEFPQLFDRIQFGNAFPLTTDHKVQFLWLRGRPPTTFETTRCMVTYLNTDSLSVMPMGNPMTEAILYQHQHKFLTIPPGSIQFKTPLNLNHPTIGIYIALYSVDDCCLERANLLARIEISTNRHSTIVSAPGEIQGKCAQFVPIAPTPPTAIDCLEVQSCVFPVEVWQVIIRHLDDPRALMKTCKYLWKICQLHDIRQLLYDKCNRADGWYCLPFNSNQLSDYKMADCSINFSRVDLQHLHLDFFVPTDRPLVVHVVAINFNVIRRMQEMMGLGYSN